MVALLTYIGLWSIGSTTIVYALLSILSLYGDWQIIYRSPDHESAATIGVCHIIIVGLFLWAIYGTRPRLWFVSHTQPAWHRDHQRIEAEIEKEPSAQAFVRLGWSYYTTGFQKQAEQAVADALSMDPDSLDAIFLSGWVMRSRSKLAESQACFRHIATSG